jgi:hypothetical protein
MVTFEFQNKSFSWAWNYRALYELGRELGHEYPSQTISEIQKAFGTGEASYEAMNISRALFIAGVKVVDKAQLDGIDDNFIWELVKEPQVLSAISLEISSPPQEKKKTSLKVKHS